MFCIKPDFAELLENGESYSSLHSKNVDKELLLYREYMRSVVIQIVWPPGTQILR